MVDANNETFRNRKNINSIKKNISNNKNMAKYKIKINEKYLPKKLHNE